MNKEESLGNIPQVSETSDGAVPTKGVESFNLRKTIVKEYLSRRYKRLREEDLKMLLNEFEWRDVWRFDDFLEVLNEITSERPKAWAMAQKDFVGGLKKNIKT